MPRMAAIATTTTLLLVLPWASKFKFLHWQDLSCFVDVQPAIPAWPSEAPLALTKNKPSRICVLVAAFVWKKPVHCISCRIEIWNFCCLSKVYFWILKESITGTRGRQQPTRNVRDCFTTIQCWILSCCVSLMYQECAVPKRVVRI